MSNLKNKLKLKTNLKKKIESEGQKKKDTRLLNYYDLKDGERMKVLFLPDAGSGELYRKWKMHGPNLKMKGLQPIRCHNEANQNECPICQQGFDLLNEGKEDGNDYEAYKEEAKKWFARDFTLAQCIVLESPFEINESPDGNQVKLFYLPWAIEEKIREAVMEGVGDEDDICMTPFIIKNTKKGEFNGYANSYFDRKQVDDATLDAFDEEMVEAYDQDTIDLVPDEPTVEQAEEWLDKAIERYNKENGTEEKEDTKESKSSPTKTSKEDEEEVNEKEETDEEEEESSTESSGSSIRDRLKAARNKKA